MMYLAKFKLEDGTIWSVFTKNPKATHTYVVTHTAKDLDERNRKPRVHGKTYTTKVSAMRKSKTQAVMCYFPEGCESKTPSDFKQSTPECVHIEAYEVIPAPLFSGVVEHNTWETESWFWAFPQTPAVDSKLKELEALYVPFVCSTYTHATYKIGKCPNMYTFCYGVIESTCEVSKGLKYDSATDYWPGRVSKKYVGGDYMGGGWFDIATTEEEALTAIQRAIDDFHVDQRAIYKGYPLRQDEVKEVAV